MLYLLSFLAFLSLVTLLAVYFRHAIIPHLPTRIRQMFPRLANYVPLTTFHDQVAHGFTSDTFDIRANIEEGDSRAGLDAQSVKEIETIMRQKSWGFDRARLEWHHRKLAANGIDPSGMPLDSKAVTRL